MLPNAIPLSITIASYIKRLIKERHKRQMIFRQLFNDNYFLISFSQLKIYLIYLFTALKEHQKRQREHKKKEPRQNMLQLQRKNDYSNISKIHNYYI